MVEVKRLTLGCNLSAKLSQKEGFKGYLDKDPSGILVFAAIAQIAIKDRHSSFSALPDPTAATPSASHLSSPKKSQWADALSVLPGWF